MWLLDGLFRAYDFYFSGIQGNFKLVSVFDIWNAWRKDFDSRCGLEMVLFSFWVGIVNPSSVFFSLKPDLALREREVFSVGEFRPLYLFESVLGLLHLEFIRRNGDVQRAVKRVVKIQAKLLEIWLLLFDAPIFGVSLGWARSNAVSFFESAF